MLELLKALLKAFAKVCGGFVSEDGIGSYSRASSMLIVVATLSWISYLVVKNGTMPDLQGPTLFLGAGTGIQYGLNQAKIVTKAWKGDTNATAPVPANTPSAGV